MPRDALLVRCQMTLRGLAAVYVASRQRWNKPCDDAACRRGGAPLTWSQG
jgi:hypothetical protein